MPPCATKPPATPSLAAALTLSLHASQGKQERILNALSLLRSNVELRCRAPPLADLETLFCCTSALLLAGSEMLDVRNCLPLAGSLLPKPH